MSTLAADIIFRRRQRSDQLRYISKRLSALCPHTSNFDTSSENANSRPRRYRRPPLPPHAIPQSPNMASQSVQCFGKKKTATAVAHCKAGKGLVKVNGKPLSLVQPEMLRFKVYEPILIIGADKFADVDIRVRVSGGGHTSQVYAIRQAIAKSIIAYYQKFVDEHSKNQLKQALVQYDRTLLVADNRRCEPKKFGGPGARAKYQKSYR
ncbi:unnamed protein product [Periconia digitata]|uniref:40S ribosomal protein S16 n=1 Tax=Periconia digitata TaxID=1303443 RepID=A0A9W4XW37_9PLEO|nr:unnamed protein product [Periconia digitata]